MSNFKMAVPYSNLTEPLCDVLECDQQELIADFILWDEQWRPDVCWYPALLLWWLSEANFLL